jgi:hypothetical protein
MGAAMELGTPQQDASQSWEERRRHGRWQVRWWAQIEVGTDVLACTVSDLSVSGVKIKTSRPTAVEEPVRLALPPFGDFKGAVVWTRDDHIGVRFADEEHYRVAKIIDSHLIRTPL